MSERMTDDELRLMADSQPLGPSWTRDVLVELLEHRTRIAAHAAAYPERLSDRTLCDLSFHMMNEIGDHLEHDGGVGLSIPDARTVVAALLEIQQRRAEDLTPDGVAAVRDLLLSLDGEPRAMRCALTKILSAHGVSP